MGHRVLTVAVMLATCLAATGGGAAQARVSTHPCHDATFDLTPAQQQAAVHVAHQEARDSIPSGYRNAHPWPTNVNRVKVSGRLARCADTFVDGSSHPDSAHFVVIQLRGHFDVETTGPPGSPSSEQARRITALMSASSGDVTDGGVGNHLRLLHYGVLIFKRS